MPAATEYLEPKDAEKLAKDERSTRSALLKAYWRYYEGNHREFLTVEPGEPNDNVIINFAKKLVLSGVAMLVGGGVEFDLVADDRTEAEQYLDAVWGGGIQGRSQRKGILLNDIAINGYVTGHAAIKLVPATRLIGGRPGLRLVNIDPGILTVFWAAGDIENVLWYALDWSEQARQDIVKQPDGTWVIRDFARRSGRARWDVTAETVWPFQWPPIVDWKNLPAPNRYYGASDLDDADLNDRLNFIASNINRILKHHASPKTIGTGMSAEQVQDTGIDSFWAIPNQDAKIFNLEMQSDLSSSQAWFNTLWAAFFSVSRGVDLSSMRDKLGQLTNFALRVLYKDALDHLGMHRLLYGDAFVELNSRILEYGGFGAGLVTTVKWPEPLPVNRHELVESAAAERAIGTASLETLAEELGRDWREEQARLALEGEELSGGEKEVSTES